jgi:hypothetical protein
MTLRIVQWTTGNVGKQSVIAIARIPGWSWWAATRGLPTRSDATSGAVRPGSVGRDRHRRRRRAARVAPDCVMYNPMWPSTDELVRILAAV